MPGYRKTKAKKDAHSPVAPAPQIGKLVGYVLERGPKQGAVRPAIITELNDDETVNLFVFADSAAGGDGWGNMSTNVRRGIKPWPGEGDTRGFFVHLAWNDSPAAVPAAEPTDEELAAEA